MKDKKYTFEEVINNITENEFLYVGYFDYYGKEYVDNGKIQRLSGRAIKLLNGDKITFYKVKDGFASEFAKQLLEE